LGNIVFCFHSQIPYKRKDTIIRHIAKTIGRYSYNLISNNCEHLVKGCVFGLNDSGQVGFMVGGFYNMALDPLKAFPLSVRIEMENRRLDNLTSNNYYYEKERIERHIREAENNHSYTRSKYQIEQEKFQERIVVYPKDWCRIQ
jgi:hypothetical protein